MFDFCSGMSGCGLPCRDPLYTEDEHQQIHRLVAWGAGTCLALNLLTVATFLIDWRSANKYPALVIFYINVCFAVASMGYVISFDCFSCYFLNFSLSTKRSDPFYSNIIHRYHRRLDVFHTMTVAILKKRAFVGIAISTI